MPFCAKFTFFEILKLWQIIILHVVIKKNYTIKTMSKIKESNCCLFVKKVKCITYFIFCDQCKIAVCDLWQDFPDRMTYVLSQ